MCRFLCGHNFSSNLGKYQRAPLLGCMIRVCIILETSSLLEGWYLFGFLTAMNECSCCSTSLTAFDDVSVLDFSHSDRCVVDHALICNSLMTCNVEHLFTCLSAIYMVKCLSDLLPI